MEANMRFSYDERGDTLLIQFTNEKISRDAEIGPNTFAAYDRSGTLVEIQILDVSDHERPWLTVEAASVYLQKSTRTIERWIKDGKLKAKKVGREYHLELKEIQKLAEAG
jgi:excisionase family DNA binding protein